MPLFRLPLAVLIPLWFVAPLHAQTWEQGSGTEGLNLQAIHFHEGWAYTGGATGTYHSEDGGATYAEANIGNSSVGPTRGFTHDDLYVYMCTSNGVFRSDNAGASWTSVDDGLPQLLSHGMAAASDRIWVVTPSGAYTSVDHGDNWLPAGLDGLDVRCIAILNDVAYAGTQGDGLFRSDDNGANWTAINNGTTSSAFRAIEAHGSTLFAAGGIGSGIFRSSDEGANWTLLSGGLPGGTFRGFASQGDWIAAAAFGNGLYVSNDNGDSWTGLNDGLGDLTLFDVDFSDSHLLVATDLAGAWRLPLDALPQGPSQVVEVRQAPSPYPNPSGHWVHFPSVAPNAAFEAWNARGQSVKTGELTEGRLDASSWFPTQWVITFEGGERHTLVVVQ